MRSAQLTFDLQHTEAEWTFLQEYMVPAWDRFQSVDAFESGWFWRAGSFARHETRPLTREEHDLERLEAGQLTVVVSGDPDAVIEEERPRWADWHETGPLEGWEIQSFDPTYENAKAKLREKYGPVGGERAYVLRQRAADLTIECLRAFDERLPPVGESTEENPVPIGYWALTHFLFKQQGYDWGEEIDAATMTIENRLQSLATFRGATAATKKQAALVDRLEALEIEDPGPR